MIRILRRSALLTVVAAGVLACSQPAETPTATATSDTKDSSLAVWPVLSQKRTLDPATEARIDALLAKLTVEEKVGQLIQADIAHVTPEDLKTYPLGSILNGGNSAPEGNVRIGPEAWLALADAFYEAAGQRDGTHVPLLWGTDAVHGHNNAVGATIFPHNIGLGAARDPELMARIGEITALETVITGQDWSFAPTVAVARNDRWGRTYESYSENPEIVASYAGKIVEGLQGEIGDPRRLRDGHVISSAKHFVGDGGTHDGIDQGDTRASEQELAEIHAAGYPSAIEAGVEIIMASFNSWQGNKLHGHKYLLTDVLKEHWGFDGFIVGDWNGHGQVADCMPTRCPAAIMAGLDMYMAPDSWQALYRNTLDDVANGAITEVRLDDAVRRILRVKIRAGLFAKPKPSERYMAGDFKALGSPAHRAVARQAVRKSLVLLKNNDAVLPVAGDARVLVTGDGAHDMGKQTGGWTLSWQGSGNSREDFPNANTIWEGFEETLQSLGGEAVYSADGSYDQRPDVAIVVFGEGPYAEFTGDRNDVAFREDGTHLRLLEQYQAAGIPTVAVFLSGRPMWVNRYLNASDAFVAAFLPGSEGGGIADVLIADSDGKAQHDFVGRLSFSWPNHPLHATLNVGNDGPDPLFAFGYGLDYTATTSLAAVEPLPDFDLTAVDTQQILVVRGAPVRPWSVTLESGDYSQDLSGRSRLSVPALSAARQDYRSQEDALRLAWTGGHATAIVGGQSVDWTRAANGDVSLVLEAHVDPATLGDVALQLGCGDACNSPRAVADFLPADATGGWHTLQVPLKCLTSDTNALAGMNEPVSLSATRNSTIALHAVHLGPTEGPVRCGK
ncbi:MAG: glycoside hydrolase family 3 N-terminal domain-containing protein [Pseudomonadota bacterium]